MLLNIAGGVALLLWATRLVRTGIMRAFGAEVRRVLGQSINNPLTAFAIGLGITALVQSSTATALLLISFAGRGLVAVPAGLAVTLGAYVGTTIIVQVLSFDISWLSPILILAGVAAFFASEARGPRQIGRILVGVGLMLLSLQLIVTASNPLQQSETLHGVLMPLDRDPILAVLLAALLTWLSHSSIATVLLFMSLTTAGVLPLPLGMALILGANLGSAIVPMVLSFKSGPEARRIPLASFAFRLIGALAALPLVPFAVAHIGDIGGAAARQMANFHTLFNIALAVVFLPFVGVVGRLAERLLPRGAEVAGPAKPRHLDNMALDMPPVALAGATREVLRMADMVEEMLRNTIEVFAKDDSKLAAKLSKLDDDVDALHEAIKFYLTELSRNLTDEADSKRCMDLLTFAINLEHIGDIIDKNLMELAQKKIRKRMSFSADGWTELKDLHARVVSQMQLAMSVFVSSDIAMARQLMREKEQFRTLEMQASERHIDRLKSGRIESIESSALHLDILRDLKRINSHLTSVAYPMLAASGELRASRLRAVQPSETAAADPPPETPTEVKPSAS